MCPLQDRGDEGGPAIAKDEGLAQVKYTELVEG